MSVPNEITGDLLNTFKSVQIFYDILDKRKDSKHGKSSLIFRKNTLKNNKTLKISDCSNNLILNFRIDSDSEIKNQILIYIVRITFIDNSFQSELIGSTTFNKYDKYVIV